MAQRLIQSQEDYAFVLNWIIQLDAELYDSCIDGFDYQDILDEIKALCAECRSYVQRLA